MRSLEDESDAALLRVVADGAASADRARAAKATFYRRHVRYLFAVVSKKKAALLAMGGLSPEDLVQETFLRAFDRAHTFREPIETVSPEVSTARTRAWLGRVATHLLADHMNRLREVSASPYLERVVVPEPEDEPAGDSAELSLVSEGLESLSEREREILRVTALYRQVGEEHGRLPNAVSKDLASRWGTTNDNIRAIRVRAMKKLKTFLSARGLRTGDVS